jgi:hypothetical protein
MYDKNVMRAKPFEVRDAQSPAQILNREVCAITTAYAKTFAKDSLLTLYPVAPVTRSRYAEFLSQLQQGRDVSGANGAVDIDTIASFGNGISPVMGTVTQSIAAGVLSVDWDGDDTVTMTSTDVISVLMFDPAINKAVLVQTAATYADATVDITLADYGLSATGVIAFVGANIGKYKAGADLSNVVK